MTGNLTQLAARPGMPCEKTLRHLIHSRPDFPVVRIGRKGAPYSFDLDQAERFVAAVRAGTLPCPAARAALIDQLGLTMIAKGSSDG